MMCALIFLTSVYWGQLSKCDKLSYSISQYSCSNRIAYGAVCAFAVLMFLIQFAFTTALILWRGDLISEAGLYDDISSSHNPAHMPYENIPTSATDGFSSRNTPPSADL